MINKDFVFAGNAIFTVDNGKGKHYTFNVKKKDGHWSKPVYFLSVLTGSDNEKDYKYVGMVNDSNSAVRITQGSRFKASSVTVKVAVWAFHIIYGELVLPEGYSINHSGKCGRCGRTLTTPNSIKTGLGPVCSQKAMS